MRRKALAVSLSQFATHPVQTILSVIGIAIGIANIITLISLSETAKRQTERIMSDFGANTLFVTPYFNADEPLASQGAVAAAFLPADYENAIRALPEIESVCPISVFPSHVGWGSVRKFSTLLGTRENMREIRNYEMVEGVFLSKANIENMDLVCVLGYSARRKIFGDSQAIGESVAIKGRKFKVIGSLEERGFFGFEDLDDRIYVPITVLSEMYQFDGVHTILVEKKADISDDAAIAKIEKALRAAGGGSQGDDDFKVFSIKDFSRLRDKTFAVFSVILMGVGAIALVVAGIGIMNVMLMSVITRTREIGIRKAVGASKADVFTQFLAESAVTCIIGSIIGIGAGVAAMVGITRWAHWTPYISTGTVALAVLFSILTGIVFGLLPALRAASLDPINALRYE
ncbi:MAG: ABC transporter permease [bacterium]|jgi:putative ABC transport system permease protein